MENYKKHFEEGNMNGVTNEDEVKKILEFRKLQKLTKLDLKIRLFESELDRERIETIVSVVYATTSEMLNKIYEDAKKEVGGDREVLFDKDVMNLIKWLEWAPNKAIEKNFGSLWSRNHLIVGENGEGVLIVGCLSC